MRNIDSIIVHCSATKAGQDFTATDIDRWHRERGFNGIGYHYVIRLDGKLEKGRDVALAGAHCKGWNEQSIGICYIGGLDENGRPADTRTNAQKRVLYQIIMDLQREYNILQVLGHRDTSPDLNGDGVIEPYEYVKACPCFDVKEFLRSGRELLFVLLVALVVPVLLSGCRSKKEVINRESEVRVDSSLNSSSGLGNGRPNAELRLLCRPRKAGAYLRYAGRPFGDLPHAGAVYAGYMAAILSLFGVRDKHKNIISEHWSLYGRSGVLFCERSCKGRWQRLEIPCVQRRIAV